MNPCLPPGYRIFGHFTGIVGLSANALLIYLIVKSKTPKEMHFFNKMLFYRAIVETAEVFFTWILEP
ncbi:hypothetical protein AAVH_34764, partial [Aphelenchoides avenae]